MTAYVIFLREEPVRDADAMAEYQNAGRTNPSDFAVVPLAIYGALEGLEGQAPDGAVILQFPTVEDAKAWYDSPAYQARIPSRRRAAEYRGFIVEGL